MNGRMKKLERKAAKAETALKQLADTLGAFDGLNRGLRRTSLSGRGAGALDP